MSDLVPLEGTLSGTPAVAPLADICDEMRSEAANVPWLNEEEALAQAAAEVAQP